MIRSTPTGISAVVDSFGEVQASVGWGKVGVIETRLLPPGAPTLFARFGNIIPLALGFLLLFGAIALARQPRYRHT